MSHEEVPCHDVKAMAKGQSIRSEYLNNPYGGVSR